MMEKENKAARDLEATQLVTLDDLNELKQLQRDHAEKTAPARRRIMQFGAALGLVIAAACCLALLLLHGGH